MNLKLSIAITFLSSLLLLSSVQAQSFTKEEGRELSLNLLKQHSPSSYHLIMKQAAQPKEAKVGAGILTYPAPWDFMNFVNTEDIESLIASLNNTVKNINHEYTYRQAVFLLERADTMNYDTVRTMMAFYIDSTHSIIVPRTAVFRTREINEFIPEKCKTYSYKSMVYPGKRQSNVQSDGIYGLLNEWNSCYHGTRTAFELYPFFEARSEQDFGIWKRYVSNVAGSYFSYLEIKLYILEYLLYAQANHPEMYEKIISNDNFRLAYRSIDERFAQLTQAFFDRIDELIIAGRRARTRVRIRDHIFYVVNRGVAIYTEEWEILSEALASPRYEPIMAALAQ